MTTLKLVLGDQLNPNHSWFADADPEAIIVFMEVHQETQYVLHHAQKVIAIFAAMRDLAGWLSSRGHRVHYLAIDDPENLQAFGPNLDWMLARYEATGFLYQEPDEWRLDQQLADYVALCAVPGKMVDSEHFLTRRETAGELFRDRKQWLMESFYRHMRVRHDVLMEGRNRPVGGKWNFDQDNRKPWPGHPTEPADRRPRHDHSALWQIIVRSGVRSFGEPQARDFAWPLNRAEALAQLDDFVTHALPHFGDYQDAMSSRGKRLFHSLLSFALNVKMLNPAEVIARAVAAGRDGSAPLEAVEGFVRQILGWREYVRGFYWSKMPGYAEENYFGHDRDLPPWFWTGETQMNCLSQAIGSSLEDAHTHHIQRLMVIGNFALLAGLDPRQVHQWYLGIYIDAFEWVELPNTLGMSQFADGGLLATKPYVSSAAYIHRMSDYCSDCRYDRKQRLGPEACPFNALYWDFFDRNRARLAANHRLAMPLRQLDRMELGDLQAIREQASAFRASIEQA